MPIYAFTCGGCGPFDLTRSVAEAGAGAECPVCGQEARRLFSPPGLARLARPLRVALEREEQSADAPDVVTRKRGLPLPHGHGAAPPWVLSH